MRGTTEDGRFQTLWVGADERITAAMHVNDWDAGDGLRRLVESGEALDPCFS
jgi:hypothetical protein